MFTIEPFKGKYTVTYYGNRRGTLDCWVSNPKTLRQAIRLRNRLEKATGRYQPRSL